MLMAFVGYNTLSNILEVMVTMLMLRIGVLPFGVFIFLGIFFV